MKVFFAGLILGVFVGASGYWYLVQGRKTTTVRHAQDSTATTLTRTVEALQAKLQALHLNGEDIQQDLTRTGRVMRRSARDFGAAVADATADATADARMTSTIKAKIALNRDLSAWNISVSTTDGRVTLAGTVASHAQIGKAMLLALETDGVRDVTSTLRVKHG